MSDNSNTIDKSIEEAINLVDRIESVSKALRKWAGVSSLFTLASLSLPIIANSVTLTNLIVSVATGTIIPAYGTYVSRQRRKEIRDNFRNFENTTSALVQKELTPLKNTINKHTDPVEKLLSLSDIDVSDPKKIRTTAFTAISFLCVPPLAPTVHFTFTSLRESFDNGRVSTSSAMAKKSLQSLLEREIKSTIDPIQPK